MAATAIQGYAAATTASQGYIASTRARGAHERMSASMRMHVFKGGRETLSFIIQHHWVDIRGIIQTEMDIDWGQGGGVSVSLTHHHARIGGESAKVMVVLHDHIMRRSVETRPACSRMRMM